MTISSKIQWVLYEERYYPPQTKFDEDGHDKDSFITVRFGTFAGEVFRIFYALVGLAWNRRKPQKREAKLSQPRSLS
jgi:hypothetical protein